MHYAITMCDMENISIVGSDQDGIYIFMGLGISV